VTERDRIVAILRTPLMRSSAALVANTAINGALGLAYWVVAARLLEPSIVGLGAAGYSGMVFAASVGWIGLQQVLLRYLPASGRNGLRLILAVYAAALAIAFVAAVAFLAYASGDPSLNYLVAGPTEVLAFIGAVLIWVVFSLQDPALIGLRRAPLVPLENLAFGITKLVLLLLVSGLASPWTILGTWVLGASWLVVVINLVIRRTIRRQDESGALPDRRRILRFGVGQQLIAVTMAAPESLVPIIVLGLVSDAATAYYVAAWQVAFTIRLIAVNLGSAITVEGSVVGASHTRLRRQARLIAPSFIIPAVGVAVLFAPLIMGVFGEPYEAEATNLFRLLALAVLPFTLVTMFVVGERIAERTAPALLVVTTTTVTTLALDLLLLPQYGLVAAGWSLLVAQSIGAGLATIIVWRRRLVASSGPLPDGNTNRRSSYHE
jgi:O-antigen/teichoic acid export membrane protein